MDVVRQEGNLNHKQQCESDHEPPKTLQSVDGNENDKLAETIESTSLTRIYYDCLERIFELLDLEDLLNVAQTCKRLQLAAAANFNDRYGMQTIRFYLKTGRNGISGITIDDDTGIIKVVDIKFCLPFLRCFGSKIAVLEVYYVDAYASYEVIDDYIHQYCSDSLMSIRFGFIKRKLLNGSILQPLEEADGISMTFGRAKQTSNFVDWFPRHWKIYRGSSLNPALLPSLNHFSLDFEFQFKFNLADFLRANKQLQSFRIGMKHDVKLSMSTLLDMLNENTSITRLIRFKYRTDDFTFDATYVSGDELFQLANKFPQMTELGLGDCLLNGESAIGFFRHMRSLKRFEFRIKDRTEYKNFKTTLGNAFRYRKRKDRDNASHYMITLEKRNAIGINAGIL